MLKNFKETSRKGMFYIKMTARNFDHKNLAFTSVDQKDKAFLSEHIEGSVDLGLEHVWD